MHVYESAASGIGYPYVWDQVWGWRDTPLTYDQMRQRCPQEPYKISHCGPNVKPAEDAPEEDELERLPSIRHQTNANTNAPAASDSDEQPAAAGPVDHVVDALPMAATAEATQAKAPAAEAQPPATDEASTMQPPEKRVPFSKESARTKWPPTKQPPPTRPLSMNCSMNSPPVKAPPGYRPPGF